MIELARTKLAHLEEDKRGIPISPDQEVMPAVSEVENLLAEIEPDSLSPREALDLLYQLKAMQQHKKQ